MNIAEKPARVCLFCSLYSSCCLISDTVELKVKFYTPDGKLNVATSAPYGYSYSNEVYVDVGENELYLSGYGNSEEGAWQSGLYTIEVWYNDVCLKHITFRLY